MAPRRNATFVPRVPADLSHLVAEAHAYDMRGFCPGVHVGLSSPTITLLVAVGDGVDMVRMPRPDRPGGRFHALVGGLHPGPVGVGHDGNQTGVQLQLHATAIPDVFGMPAADLHREVVDLRQLWPAGAVQELLDRVSGTEDQSVQADAVFEMVRRQRQPRPRAIDRVLSAGWDLLTSPRGPSRIDGIAHQLGWDRRTLGQRVSREFGVNPVTARSIARFDRAQRLIREGTALADAAAVSGYADQPHLTRDFKRFIGASPTRWLADEQLPFVQDGVRPE